MSKVPADESRKGRMTTGHPPEYAPHNRVRFWPILLKNSKIGIGEISADFYSRREWHARMVYAAA